MRSLACFLSAPAPRGRSLPFSLPRHRLLRLRFEARDRQRADLIRRQVDRPDEMIIRVRDVQLAFGVRDASRLMKLALALIAVARLTAAGDRLCFARLRIDELDLVVV